MIKNRIKLTVLILLLCGNAGAWAQNPYARIQPANPLSGSPSVDLTFIEPKKATLSKNDIYNQYAIGLNRFMQSNVRAAYADFNVLIESISQSDYAYLQLATKMADIGFFNLAELALGKVRDKDISNLLNDEIKRFYFPSAKLSKSDEVYLGEIFSNIIYNDQSREATAELVKNTVLMQGSDYANYLAALGSLKSGNNEAALKYADTAIAKNPQNINYSKLKAEILSQGKKPQNALKIVKAIKQQPLLTTEYANKVNSLEQYILFKVQKNESLKNYHLGYYYYYEKELNKALKTLQSAGSNKKKTNREVYALLSRVYFDMKEFEKAQDIAQKAYKLDKNNVTALLVLGDISYRNKDYKTALKYYERAADNEKISSIPLVRTAETYQMLEKDKKAKEIFAKILKNNSDCYQAYYHMALYDKDREVPYLKKSLALNLAYKDAWIDLARVEIEKQNLRQAKIYLAIAGYIDENDFRYYYYQGLIAKAEGFTKDANVNFQKSLKLNPDYSPAKEELSI